MCSLVDPGGRREVSVDDNTLRLTDRGHCYLTVDLTRCLVVSMGRPWQPDTPAAQGIEVTRHDEELRLNWTLDRLEVTATVTFDGDVVRWRTRFANSGPGALRDIAVGVLLAVPDGQVTIPHLIYNNNPSAAADRVVPKLEHGLICETHRMPIPGINIECDSRYLSCFIEPSYDETADGRVHYGSMGVLQGSIAAMSGVLLFNGEPDVCYVHKAQTETREVGYRTLPPGGSLAIEIMLDCGRVAQRGHGFRALVHKAHVLFQTDSRRLDLDEIVRRKVQALDARWHQNAGYLKFLGGDHDAVFMYGWTGQCLKLAWCDAFLGDAHRLDRCRRAVDFYLGGSGTAIAGLRMNVYDVMGQRWTGFIRNGVEMVSSRALGETLCDIADIVLLMGEDRWVDELRRSAAFLVGQGSAVLPIGWRTDGTPTSETETAAGLPCVLALIKIAQVTEDDRYLAAATELLDSYYRLHAETFERPFAHSTLDAACEDKEGGIFYFLCVAELFAITGEPQYRDRAAVAADWLLTWVYVWSPAFDRGSPLRGRGFSAAGMPGVSVQNHHLDVFFPAYELRRFGQQAGIPQYVQIADAVMAACAQGISAGGGDWGFDQIGEQGEAFFQTNWQERGTSNTWSPSWIIAQVLANALRIRESAASDIVEGQSIDVR